MYNNKRKNHWKKNGFTLIEILVALFIFTILALILMNALHNIISFQAGTEKKAARLRELQMTLLLFSRDVESAVNRPVTLGNGREDAVFRGNGTELTFTEIGALANHGESPQMILSRTRYYVDKNHTISRARFLVLDQTTKTQMTKRQLLTNVESAEIQYVDDSGKPHAAWPLEGQLNQALPRAVIVTLTLAHWGKIKQTFVIKAMNDVKPSSEKT